ncbi:hypothetical protein CHS0354_006587 [Potamilus streckersoni]|uniref:Uncharacterized protein n=1 Tax=Potamilus streckersoni TaxID=2493646 RepID=A0AAE0SWL5_9BIVA|nr:hypothetical protein CHS0354_006587 [Potamilus streckersoni]
MWACTAPSEFSGFCEVSILTMLVLCPSEPRQLLQFANVKTSIRGFGVLETRSRSKEQMYALGRCRIRSRRTPDDSILTQSDHVLPVAGTIHFLRAKTVDGSRMSLHVR